MNLSINFHKMPFALSVPEERFHSLKPLKIQRNAFGRGVERGEPSPERRKVHEALTK